MRTRSLPASRPLTLLVLAAALTAAGPARAGARTAGPVFTRVVQTGDPIPGGATDAFSSFGAPATDGKSVSFYAKGSVREGIFTTATGALAVVAERTTLLPGTNVNFAFFGGPILENGVSLVSGLGAGGLHGVYLGDGGPLTVVADVFTPVPDGFGTFSDIGGFDAGGSSVVIQGRDSAGRPGIYRRRPDGTLALVANDTTPIPGGGNFEFLDLPAAAGKTVALRGGPLNQGGLYAATRNGLTTIADTKTQIPGGPGGTPFGFFEQTAAGGGTLAFIGGDAFFSYFGVFTYTGGTLGLVADIFTPIPGGGGSVFSGFFAPGAGKGAVVFTGFGSLGEAGLWVSANGVIAPLLLAGDPLDGRTVSEVSFQADGIEGRMIAVAVSFTDGSSGIYTATLPL